MKLTNTEKMLLLLLRRGVFEKKEQPSDIGISKEEINFEEIKKEADAHVVSALALDGTVDLDVQIPEKLFDLWQGESLQLVLENENLLQIQSELIEFLEKNGVNGAVIKGSSVAVCYPNAESRTLGDIDYIVDINDYEKAIELLKASKYDMIEYDTNDCHAVFTKGKTVIEIHRYINGLPEGEDGEYIKNLYYESLKSERIKNEINGFSFYSMSNVSEAITQTIHILSHLTKGGIGLRHLCDFAIFVYKNSNDEFDKKIKDILQRIGLYKFYSVLILCAKKFLFDEITEKTFELDETKLEDKLFADIITAGNFGRKSPESFKGSSLFTRRTVVKTKNGTESKVLFWKNFLWFINHAWTPTQKHPILIPIAIFYIPLRYLVRVICKKRKMISKDYIKTATNRSKFIDDLEIYKK